MICSGSNPGGKQLFSGISTTPCISCIKTSLTGSGAIPALEHFGSFYDINLFQYFSGATQRNNPARVYKKNSKRVFNDLRVVAIVSPNFEWIKIRKIIVDCFYRVQAAWEKNDVSEASVWMTDWYWQNQQVVFLKLYPKLKRHWSCIERRK